jgi:AcrR family transcriptional regulator
MAPCDLQRSPDEVTKWRKPSGPARARRTPRQQRSVQAVAAIFEATARLIESQGLETLTTARIAEVAGYGVGTVYDYFPTKNAILLAMARQELDKTLGSVLRELRHTDSEGPATATQRAMRAMIRGFGGRRRLRGALLATMMAQGHSSELTRPVEMIADFLRQQQEPAYGIDLMRMPPEQLYVLTRAIVGVIRAWAMEGGAQVSAQTLELELTELVRGYVQHCLTRA